MKNTLVTVFKNVKTNTGHHVKLYDWLTDDTNKEAILKTRAAYGTEMYKELKDKLPCASISGTFEIRRTDRLIKHSGYICIDIDGKENPGITDYEKLRDELSNVVNISFATLSVGGNGVFCIIPISNPEKHKEHFYALEKCFRELGIIVDSTCKDITRVRIVSHDPNAFFNDSAIPFTELAEETKTKRKSKEKPEKTKTALTDNSQTTNFNKEATKRKVLEIINKIKSSKKDITKVYEEWFKLACALYAEFEENGRDLYHQLSKNNPKYNPLICDAQFDAVVERKYNRTQIGTFFYIAKEHGLID